MKKCGLVVCLILVILSFSSCESRKEKKAIEICQNTKIEWGGLIGEESSILVDFVLKLMMEVHGIDTDHATWLNFANMLASEEPNKQYSWSARKTDVKNIYIVRFEDEEDWGLSWRVDIKENIVVLISNNKYLSRNEGITRLDTDSPFEVKDIIEASVDFSEGDEYGDTEGVTCSLQGTIVNHTGRALSSAELDGGLDVIFENKTVEGDISWRSAGLARDVSESEPWYDGEEIAFEVHTKPLPRIYMEYEPQYVFFTLEINVSDPIGYSYEKGIFEKDLKDHWNQLRANRNSEVAEDTGDEDE